jgi:uncharacterized Zn finger protein
MRRRRYYDDDDDFFHPGKPIETDQGIKAKTKRGAFTKNWWAERWIAALEGLLDPGRLRRGRSYARKGQVLSIKETKKGVEAKVQGSRPAPYTVNLAMEHLTGAQWDRVIEAMAGQALFTAQLLAGEMPQDIEQAFETAGASLFPATETQLSTKCSCPDPANPCKHIAAVHFILGERFDEDPFLIFRLRGRTQEQILANLRARRAAGAGKSGESEEEAEAVVPLAEQLQHFWDLGAPLVHFQTQPKPPLTPLPTLRRLGQPTFLSDDLLTLLGPAYQTLTQAALNTALGEEREPGERNDE